jgi:hypothetical protein
MQMESTIKMTLKEDKREWKRTWRSDQTKKLCIDFSENDLTSISSIKKVCKIRKIS